MRRSWRSRGVDALLPVDGALRQGELTALVRVVTPRPPVEEAHSPSRASLPPERGRPISQVKEERDEIVVSVAGIDSRAKVRLHLARQRKLHAVPRAASSTRSMSFSMSAVVNVAEKSLRSRASVLYFTNGAPAASSHHLEERCARDAGRLAENKCFGHHLREYGDHQFDRELHGRACSPSPT